MEEIKEKKHEIRNQMARRLDELSPAELNAKNEEIERRLFEFANFMEAKVALLYLDSEIEVLSRSIIERSFQQNKIVVLPVVKTDTPKFELYKVDNLETDLLKDDEGTSAPDPGRCKLVPIDRIDIAIVPGVAFDDKGGRIGSGDGYYDRLIPKLPITTRKVGLAFDHQIVPQIPMESHDKHVDIIITEKRIIYKI